MTDATTSRNTIEGRLAEALDWWQANRPNQTTSSLTGTGAIRELETWFAVHVDHVAGFAVGSGTQALIAGLTALGAGRGSAVALPAYDWTAALAATLAVGAEPVWCDVGPNGVITPLTVQDLEPSFDVIVATSLLGYPVDIRAIRDLNPDVPIVEDCTQALGSLRNGRPAGTDADVAVWSLGHGKHLDAGEGGVITARDQRIADQVLRVTQHPLRQTTSGLDPSYLAATTRLHPGAALLAVAQLDDIESRLRLARSSSSEATNRARLKGVFVPETEPSVAVASKQVMSFEPNGHTGIGFRIGDPVYPISPPSLVDESCPPCAELWTRQGRFVFLDREPESTCG